MTPKPPARASDEDAKALEHAATLAAPIHAPRGHSAMPTELFEPSSIHLGDQSRLQSSVEIVIRIVGRQGARHEAWVRRILGVERAVMGLIFAVGATGAVTLGLLIGLALVLLGGR